MSITYKGNCPCDDFEMFALKYTSPTEEPVQLFCPFCGVAIEESAPINEDEEDDDIYE